MKTGEHATCKETIRQLKETIEDMEEAPIHKWLADANNKIEVYENILKREKGDTIHEFSAYAEKCLETIANEMKKGVHALELIADSVESIFLLQELQEENVPIYLPGEIKNAISIKSKHNKQNKKEKGEE